VPNEPEASRTGMHPPRGMLGDGGIAAASECRPKALDR
jgi:hypothetical protein